MVLYQYLGLILSHLLLYILIGVDAASIESNFHPDTFRHDWVSSFRDSSTRPRRMYLDFIPKWKPDTKRWRSSDTVEFDIAEPLEITRNNACSFCRAYLGLARHRTIPLKRITTKHYLYPVIIKFYPKYARNHFLLEAHQQYTHHMLLESGTLRDGEMYLVSKLTENNIASLIL